jgi:hypothetical protein
MAAIIQVVNWLKQKVVFLLLITWQIQEYNAEMKI